MAPRALVYRTLGLGDLLTGVPALRALRRALPDHRIVLAAPEAQRPLVELIALAGAIDELVPTEELCPVAWPGPAPEIAVDLHGNGPASRAPLAALRPGRLVAFDLSGGPRWNPDEHERHRWCRLVAESFGVRLGVDADPGDLRLPAPAASSVVPGAVVVHPGAASQSRRWPARRYAAVAGALVSAGLRVLVTGSAGERSLADEVRRGAGLAPADVLTGRTDLGTLAAQVAQARLVICGDTGTAHLASAFGTPSVLLFGPTPPALWGPPPGPHTVLWHGTGAGDPHGNEIDPALLAITVDEVLAAAGDLLSGGE